MALNCGCKGIRTCLLCEKPDGKTIHKSFLKKEILQYSYCPCCNLCWLINENSARSQSFFLSKLKVYPNFLSADEESLIIVQIDKIPWAQSQSGRMKQDFGPKVNFKKKKGKIGDFKGFPMFSKSLIENFQKLEELRDFRPVELCHLDYSPERGSSIDPHIDDSWIWGERLVTINLSSSTVLTLSPANLKDCDCLKTLDGELYSVIANPSCQHLPQAAKKDPLAASDCPPPKIMCEEFRTSRNEVPVEVQIMLPPRSLVILGGCCRYNWFHEIKRHDITSRRLAMTFRELSDSFLNNDTSEKDLGDQLLDIGKVFY